jgi:phosphotransferase system enzyme I (PtsP)
VGIAIPDRVTLLADVAEIVSRSHDLEETLGNVVDLVGQRLQADACSVYLTDADIRHLTLRASDGLDESAVGQLRVAFGEGLVGLSAERGEPIAIERARQHPRFRHFPESGEDRFESLMAAPIRLRNISIGVLVVQTEKPRGFTTEEVELLQTCAHVIAPVVMNAQLLAMVNLADGQRAEVLGEMATSGLPVAIGGQARPAHNLEVHGIPAARGVAIGPLYRLEDPLDLENLDYTRNADLDVERRELLQALADAVAELQQVRDKLGVRFGPEFAAVFNTHIQILEDSGFVAALEQAVDETRDALRALRQVLAAYQKTFQSIEDPYFAERGDDIRDAGLRVMANLLGVRHHNIPLSGGAIVVADMILPHHFATLEVEQIGAIVSEHGGATSHGAIFARSLEIPLVTGATGILDAVRPGELAIVDGSLGRVYLSPDEGLLGEYERAQQRYAGEVEHLDALGSRPAETRDGRHIALTANAGLWADMPLVDRHGAEGVGLFRTELLALAHRAFPEEDEQERLYDRVAEYLAPRSVTIRTLDLGGEKTVPIPGLEREDNPQLGWRSIRMSLVQERTFREQLRAILRASANGNVRLLLPMISSLSELRQAKALVEESKRELAARGEDFDADMPLGIMIEVPSAALIADALAAECDFFSVGTNDLTQYTLAVDRGNERVDHLYDPLHPAVLALIDRSVRAARRAGIPLSVCGEMAGNPLAVPILVGLGVRELSAAPSAVPIMKEIIRALDFGDLEEDARRALRMGTAEEVKRVAAARLRKAGLHEHPDVGPWLTTILEDVA